MSQIAGKQSQYINGCGDPTEVSHPVFIPLIWVLSCCSLSVLMKIWLMLTKVSLVSYLLLRSKQIWLPPM
jgi:hypothetical protein